MTADIIPFRPKTIAEQRLEHLEGLKRPLTDEESEQLRRSLHAVYCHNRTLAARANALKMHEREERELLAKLEAEAAQGEWR